MTNKEELQKHIQLLNEIKVRYPILNDTIKYLEEYQQTLSNPTFNECIKEWIEKKYRVHNYKRELIIESKKYDLTINICKANLIYEISNYYEDKPAFITPELHELLTQTLKAMEKMKNDKN